MQLGVLAVSSSLLLLLLAAAVAADTAKDLHAESETVRKGEATSDDAQVAPVMLTVGAVLQRLENKISSVATALPRFQETFAGASATVSVNLALQDLAKARKASGLLYPRLQKSTRVVIQRIPDIKLLKAILFGLENEMSVANSDAERMMIDFQRKIVKKNIKLLSPLQPLSNAAAASASAQTKIARKTANKLVGNIKALMTKKQAKQGSKALAMLRKKLVNLKKRILQAILSAKKMKPKSKVEKMTKKKLLKKLSKELKRVNKSLDNVGSKQTTALLSPKTVKKNQRKIKKQLRKIKTNVKQTMKIASNVKSTAAKKVVKRLKKTKKAVVAATTTTATTTTTVTPLPSTSPLATTAAPGLVVGRKLVKARVRGERNGSHKLNKLASKVLASGTAAKQQKALKKLAKVAMKDVVKKKKKQKGRKDAVTPAVGLKDAVVRNLKGQSLKSLKKLLQKMIEKAASAPEGPQKQVIDDEIIAIQRTIREKRRLVNRQRVSIKQSKGGKALQKELDKQFRRRNQRQTVKAQTRLQLNALSADKLKSTLTTLERQASDNTLTNADRRSLNTQIEVVQKRVSSMRPPFSLPPSVAPSASNQQLQAAVPQKTGDIATALEKELKLTSESTLRFDQVESLVSGLLTTVTSEAANRKRQKLQKIQQLEASFDNLKNQLHLPSATPVSSAIYYNSNNNALMNNARINISSCRKLAVLQCSCSKCSCAAKVIRQCFVNGPSSLPMARTIIAPQQIPNKRIDVNNNLLIRSGVVDRGSLPAGTPAHNGRTGDGGVLGKLYEPQPIVQTSCTVVGC